MDLGVIIGVALGFAAILGANVMEGGNPGSLIQVPALILVFGGTFGAAMASGMLADSLKVGSLFQRAFLAKAPQSGPIVDLMVELAGKARREGLLALEEAAKGIEDDFLRKGLEMAADGVDPDEVRQVMEAKIDAKRSSDKAGAKFFADMGGFAPTIGIIGTVMGLVHVLENLSQPDKLGHLIAGAFIATLWGVLTANIMWLPMGNKLKRLAELESAQMELIVEGVSAIQAGGNPRLVASRLTSLLSPTEAKKAEQAKAA
jgi:chemotaxis protein MotA